MHRGACDCWRAVGDASRVRRVRADMDLGFEKHERSPSLPLLERLRVSPIPYSKSDPMLRGGVAAGVALERSSSIFFQPTGGSSSLRVVAFNCMCTALGTGILAIPHVLTDIGLVGGVLLLAVIWLLTERSAAFVCAAADLTGEATYTEIAAAAFGPTVGQATGVILVLYCFGSCVGGLVVLKQLLPRVLRFFLGALVYEHAREVMLAVALLILVPLSALPTMERLKFTSMASVMLQLVIVICVSLAGVSAAFQAKLHGLAHESPTPIPLLSLEPLAWMRSAPIVAFAFQFHQNVPFLLVSRRTTIVCRTNPELTRPRHSRQAELRQWPGDSKWPTKRDKLQVAVRVAGGICFVLYLAIAVAGTDAFGMRVDKNVLVSLASPRGLELLPVGLVATVMGAMSLVMVCVFPLNAFGLRVGVHELVVGGGAESTRQRWAGSLVLVCASTLVAAAVDDLGVLFGLIGATTGTYIMFLLPSSLLLRLATRSPTPTLPTATPYAPPDGSSSSAVSPADGAYEGAGASARAAAQVPLPTVNVPAASALLFAGLCIGGCGTAAVFIG